MVNDPIGDMFTEIRNAAAVSKPFVEIFYSTFRESVAKFLEKQGFLAKVKVFKEKGKPWKRLHIDLKYDDAGNPAIGKIRRVSKPGTKIYMNVADLRKFAIRRGDAIVSTSKGVMTGYKAIKAKLGGEVLGEVW